MTKAIKNSAKAKTARKSAPPTSKVGKSKTTKANVVREGSKIGTVIALLRRKEGATIEQMMKATGWQSHSVRGAMSGAIKKKHGFEIASVKNDGVRFYRIGA